MAAMVHSIIIPVSRPPMKDPPTAPAPAEKLLAQLSLHAPVTINVEPFTSREKAE